MKRSDCKEVRIKADSDEKILSKEQKAFNLLIKKIENKKKLFKDWKDALRAYQHRIHSEYNKLYDEHDQLLAELVRLLDAAYPHKLFVKAEKNKIQHMICSVVEELISDEGADEVMDIYNKYKTDGRRLDEQLLDEQVGEAMKSMFKMMGIEIDAVDVNSPEKFEAALREKMLQQEEQARLAAEKRSRRKKTARQLEKEARLQQEEQDLSKAIQNIYRKLVAELHPDLEQDAAEKARKTEIMQQVNSAYSEKDLLRLFELQLELEHIDQSHLGRIAEEKLKLFNKTLRNQLKELEQEMYHIEHGAKMEVDWLPFIPLSPEQFLERLDEDINKLHENIRSAKKYIELSASHQELKAFLKNYKIPSKKPQYCRSDRATVA